MNVTDSLSGDGFLLDVTVVVVGTASVKLVVATAPDAPVALTPYVATNQSGRLNESLMLPLASAVTLTLRFQVWPTSLTTMLTDSPGSQRDELTGGVVGLVALDGGRGRRGAARVRRDCHRRTGNRRPFLQILVYARWPFRG